MANPSLFSLLIVAASALLLIHTSDAFSPVSRRTSVQLRPQAKAAFRTVLQSADDDESSTTTTEEAVPKLTLEEKMKSWEASEEEIRAASLGGVVPGLQGGDKERTGAFDVGLYILFPFIVLSGLAFAFFPFIMGNLDLSDVGPPPIV